MSTHSARRSFAGASMIAILATSLVTARPAGSAPKNPKATPTPTRTATPASTSTPPPPPTPTRTPPPPPDGLAVIIEWPPDGSEIGWNVTDVSGTFEGPERVGVVVNGRAARLGVDSAGRRAFFVDDLPLEPGATTITASALTIEGAQVSHSVGTTAGSLRPPVRMEASPVAGSSPLAVVFEVTVDEGVSYAYPTVDFDGDGSPDTTVAERSASLSHVYTTGGLHRARLESKSAGRPIVDLVGILVANESDLVVSLQQLWEELRAALRTRDADRALNLVVASSRERASALIRAIDESGVDPDVVYGPIAPHILYDGFAEFEMARTDPDGQLVGYAIHFARDVDGIWRVKSF